MENKKQICIICGEETQTVEGWCKYCLDQINSEFIPDSFTYMVAEWGAKRREETYKSHWKKVLENVKNNSKRIEQSLKDEVEEEAKVPAIWEEGE